MKKINKYSIVIPIFNESENLVNLISEIDQIIFNKIEFEIIIVDDGSTDGTQKVLKEIIIDKKHINILVLKNSINQGQSFSIFKGIKQSCVVDFRWMKLFENKLKLVIWYDNEWGYSNRVLDVIKLFNF